MNKYSRMFLVFIVALIGTMFLSQMTAFGMELTELKDNYSVKLSVLEELGVKVSMYDKEELSDEELDLVPNKRSKIDDMEVVFVFNEPWLVFNDYSYDVFTGSKLNVESFKHLDVSKEGTREEWKMNVVTTYCDAIVNDIMTDYTYVEEVVEEPVKKESWFKRTVFTILGFLWDNWKICLIVAIVISTINQLLEVIEKVSKFFSRISAIFSRKNRKRG